jgi:transcriptional regulator with XRE-family HTH domain
MVEADDLWLGRQVKALRHGAGLTLQQVADRARLSVGLISQIERGLTSPSVRTLRQLSEALNVPPAIFFHGDAVPPPEERGIIVRQGQGPQLRLTQTGVSKWLLTPDLTGALEMMMVEIAPGGRSGDDLYSHASEACGHVLSGALRLRIEEHDFVLEPGDSFRFAPQVLHAFESASTEVTRVLWVITPPIY